MKPMFGPTIVVPLDPVKSDAENIAAMALRMIICRVTDFNIAMLPDGIMIVFRYDRDASTLSRYLGCKVEDRDCRYYPKTLFV